METARAREPSYGELFIACQGRNCFSVGQHDFSDEEIISSSGAVLSQRESHVMVKFISVVDLRPWLF